MCAAYVGGKLALITNSNSYMSFRLVPKSVTLNDLERRNDLLCVISLNLVNLAAIEHITASARIELTDQKSASITHRAVKFACVTKCKNFSVSYL